MHMHSLRILSAACCLVSAGGGFICVVGIEWFMVGGGASPVAVISLCADIPDCFGFVFNHICRNNYTEVLYVLLKHDICCLGLQ